MIVFALEELKNDLNGTVRELSVVIYFLQKIYEGIVIC